MVNWPWIRRRQGGFVGETLRVKPSKRYNYEIGDRAYNWPVKCDEYDMYYNDNPQIKSQVLTLAGRATANGIFLEPRFENQRSLDAIKECEDLNRDVGMDQLLYETIIPLVKYGTILWEQTFDPVYAAQIIPVVKEYKPNRFQYFNVSEWEILERGQSYRNPVLLREPRFVEFSWNITSTSWPYGTSLLVGLGRSLELLNELLKEIEGYMESAAFPAGLFQVGQDDFAPDSSQLSGIEAKIRNRNPGEHFVTNWPIDYKVIGPASAEPRMVTDVMDFIKDQIIDGTMTPPVSKQYQRSLASAEEMTDATEQSVIIPIQRLLKRVLERKVYWPYLERLGFSVRNVPTVSFTPPDQDKVEEAEYYGILINNKIITPEAAARELGIEEADIPEPEPIQPQLPQLPEIPPGEEVFEVRRRISPHFLGEAEDWCASKGGKWVTIKGNHICILPGETPEQAIKRQLGDQKKGIEKPKKKEESTEPIKSKRGKRAKQVIDSWKEHFESYPEHYLKQVSAKKRFDSQMEEDIIPMLDRFRGKAISEEEYQKLMKYIKDTSTSLA